MGVDDIQTEYPDDQWAIPGADIGFAIEPTAIEESKPEEPQDDTNDAYDVTKPPPDDQEGFMGEHTMNITESVPQMQPEPVKEKPEEPQESTHKVDSSPPLSEFEALRDHLEKNRYDPKAWDKYIDVAEESGDLEKIKQAYESLLQAYPNTAEAQIAYLEHFMHPGLFPTAESMFNRYLRPSPSVQLWKFYLSYVRRMNSDPSTRDTVAKAYDFALLYIGQDKDSGEIWREYLDFVKAGEAHNTWEEQQKMDALRRIYQRAVQIPLEILEQLWSEYNTFEVGLNKVTARKFIQDMNKSYMTAKEALKQLRMHLGILCPPLPSSSGRRTFYLPEPTPSNNDNHRSLAKSWRTYLQWEEKNPLDIEDKATFNARLLQTYKKAVIRMRFNPETWFMAYNWTEKHGKAEDAINFLKAGLDANPASFILNFAYAEYLENEKKYPEVHAVFTKFIEVLHEEIEKVEKTIPAEANISNGSAGLQSNSSSGSIVTPQKELATRRRELGIAWITYMRFARRAEGLKPARTVFGKARKDKYVSWEVYEAAASMEYHFTKATDVATRIYETGMKQFGEDAEYAHKYLKFLIAINDENNARALFERVIGTFTPEKARPIWETWTSYEYNYGDLTAAAKLEKRMAEVYPEDNTMRRFAQRHMYQNHDAIAIRDLGWMPPGSGSSNGSARNESSSNLLSTPVSAVAQSFPGSTSKRPASPERARGVGRSESQDMGPPPPKRQRELSPPPPPRRDVDRADRGRGDRDRREPPQSRRRYGSPPDRDRRSPPRRGADGGYGRGDWDRDGPGPGAEDRGGVPSLIGFFLSQLPPSSSFDGPIFRTDDLMQVFRTTTVPPSGQAPARGRSPPPPPRGRPPPDYGPYQGPSGGRGGGGRRY